MDNNGLVFGYVYEEGKGAKIVDKITECPENECFEWYHFDGSNESVKDQLKQEKEINEVICNELLSDVTRPSIKNYNEGVLIILRCMNFNSGSEPEDMVALHIWINGNVIITVRREKVFATDDLIESIRKGHEIRNIGDLLNQLLGTINNRIGEIIIDIEDQVDELEELLIEGKVQDVRTQLSRIRRKIVAIRRYIVPQRDVLSRMYTDQMLTMDDVQRWTSRDVSEKLIRIIEDMDLVRDRASLIHEEMNNKIAENMNKTMYMLSIVATIFLPLSFLTGLLGINVGGLPGLNNSYAFGIVCLICLVIFTFEYLFFKSRRLF